MNNFYSEAMPPATRQIFQEISAMPEQMLRDFFLIGGTGLAIQINHRVSEDIDFVIAGRELPRNQIKNIIQNFSGSHNVTLVTPQSAIDSFINDGFDIDDFQQDWLIDSTKVTFFCFNIDAEFEMGVIKQAQSANEFLRYGSIAIPSVDVIAQTKCAVFCRRIKSRDIFDLHTLVRRGNLSFEQMIAFMQKANPCFSYNYLCHRLIQAKIPDNDEGITAIGRTTLAEIREDFQSLKNEFETNLSLHSKDGHKNHTSMR